MIARRSHAASQKLPLAARSASWAAIAASRAPAWAGSTVSWGPDNRECAVRVASPFWGREAESTNVELKACDPSSNPYLALGGLILAGLDGIERGLSLDPPVEESLFEMDAARIAEQGIREMPGSLGEALEELERDAVVREALGEHVFGHYLEAKRAEWDAFRLHVSQWELDRYLEAF